MPSSGAKPLFLSLDAARRMADHRYKKWLRWVEQLGVSDFSQVDSEIWSLLVELADLKTACFLLEFCAQIQNNSLLQHPDIRWKDINDS